MSQSQVPDTVISTASLSSAMPPPQSATFKAAAPKHHVVTEQDYQSDVSMNGSHDVTTTTSTAATTTASTNTVTNSEPSAAYLRMDEPLFSVVSGPGKLANLTCIAPWYQGGVAGFTSDMGLHFQAFSRSFFRLLATYRPSHVVVYPMFCLPTDNGKAAGVYLCIDARGTQADPRHVPLENVTLPLYSLRAKPSDGMFVTTFDAAATTANRIVWCEAMEYDCDAATLDQDRHLYQAHLESLLSVLLPSASYECRLFLSDACMWNAAPTEILLGTILRAADNLITPGLSLADIGRIYDETWGIDGAFKPMEMFPKVAAIKSARQNDALDQSPLHLVIHREKPRKMQSPYRLLWLLSRDGIPQSVMAYSTSALKPIIHAVCPIKTDYEIWSQNQYGLISSAIMKAQLAAQDLAVPDQEPDLTLTIPTMRQDRIAGQVYLAVHSAFEDIQDAVREEARMIKRAMQDVFPSDVLKTEAGKTLFRRIMAAITLQRQIKDIHHDIEIALKDFFQEDECPLSISEDNVSEIVQYCSALIQRSEEASRHVKSVAVKRFTDLFILFARSDMRCMLTRHLLHLLLVTISEDRHLLIAKAKKMTRVGSRGRFDHMAVAPPAQRHSLQFRSTGPETPDDSDEDTNSDSEPEETGDSPSSVTGPYQFLHLFHPSYGAKFALMTEENRRDLMYTLNVVMHRSDISRVLKFVGAMTKNQITWNRHFSAFAPMNLYVGMPREFMEQAHGPDPENKNIGQREVSNLVKAIWDTCLTTAMICAQDSGIQCSAKDTGCNAQILRKLHAVGAMYVADELLHDEKATFRETRKDYEDVLWTAPRSRRNDAQMSTFCLNDGHQGRLTLRGRDGMYNQDAQVFLRSFRNSLPASRVSENTISYRGSCPEMEKMPFPMPDSSELNDFLDTSLGQSSLKKNVKLELHVKPFRRGNGHELDTQASKRQRVSTAATTDSTTSGGSSSASGSIHPHQQSHTSDDGGPLYTLSSGSSSHSEADSDHESKQDFFLPHHHQQQSQPQPQPSDSNEPSLPLPWASQTQHPQRQATLDQEIQASMPQPPSRRPSQFLQQRRQSCMTPALEDTTQYSEAKTSELQPLSTSEQHQFREETHDMVPGSLNRRVEPQQQQATLSTAPQQSTSHDSESDATLAPPQSERMSNVSDDSTMNMTPFAMPSAAAPHYLSAPDASQKGNDFRSGFDAEESHHIPNVPNARHHGFDFNMGIGPHDDPLDAMYDFGDAPSFDTGFMGDLNELGPLDGNAQDQGGDLLPLGRSLSHFSMVDAFRRPSEVNQAPLWGGANSDPAQFPEPPVFSSADAHHNEPTPFGSSSTAPSSSGNGSHTSTSSSSHRQGMSSSAGSFSTDHSDMEMVPFASHSHSSSSSDSNVLPDLARQLQATARSRALQAQQNQVSNEGKKKKKTYKTKNKQAAVRHSAPDTIASSASSSLPASNFSKKRKSASKSASKAHDLIIDDDVDELNHDKQSTREYNVKQKEKVLQEKYMNVESDPDAEWNHQALFEGKVPKFTNHPIFPEVPAKLQPFIAMLPWNSFGDVYYPAKEANFPPEERERRTRIREKRKADYIRNLERTKAFLEKNASRMSYLDYYNVSVPDLEHGIQFPLIMTQAQNLVPDLDDAYIGMKMLPWYTQMSCVQKVLMAEDPTKCQIPVWCFFLRMNRPSTNFVLQAYEKLMKQPGAKFWEGFGMDGFKQNPSCKQAKGINDLGEEYTFRRKRLPALPFVSCGKWDWENPDSTPLITEDRNVQCELQIAEALLVSEAARCVIQALTNFQVSKDELLTMENALIRDMRARIGTNIVTNAHNVLKPLISRCGSKSKKDTAQKGKPHPQRWTPDVKSTVYIGHVPHVLRGSIQHRPMPQKGVPCTMMHWQGRDPLSEDNTMSASHDTILQEILQEQEQE